MISFPMTGRPRHVSSQDVLKSPERLAWMLAGALAFAASAASAEGPVAVNSDNFVRAESDLYFSGIVANGGFGKLDHTREMAPLDKQTVIRLNRDTLYSSAVFDLDAGPVTITVPDAGARFLSMQIIDEDHYTHGVIYKPGRYTLTREEIGTRYVAAAFRIFADPSDPKDMDAVHVLQDKIGVEQAAIGTFEIPDWDADARNVTRTALLALAAQLPDTRGMFGAKGKVDPVRHLIGAAMGWGGNPEAEALYLNVVPETNDGQAVYKMHVGDVPVQGFWSISVYDAGGYFAPNDLGRYTLNNFTAAKNADGSVDVQFGGCDKTIANCLPTSDGWNYMVRLYRPEASILDGSWTFPVAEIAR